MPIDLKEQCDRLQRLATEHETPASRDELMAGLASKWEGVQITSARVLLQWGDPASVTAVRALLVDVAGKEGRHASTKILTHALSPLLREEDFDWALDLFFGSSRRSNRYWLGELITRFPKDKVLAAIARRKAADNVDPRDEKVVLAEFRRLEEFGGW